MANSVTVDHLSDNGKILSLLIMGPSGRMYIENKMRLNMEHSSTEYFTDMED